jgi:molybdopterin converting factor small subunit
MSVPKAPPGHFTVLYFAAAASFTCRQHDFFRAPIRSEKLFEILEERYANIRARVLSNCAITLNLDYIDVGDRMGDNGSSVEIQAGDEVAIIPPVSSG